MKDLFTATPAEREIIERIAKRCRYHAQIHLARSSDG